MILPQNDFAQTRDLGSLSPREVCVVNKMRSDPQDSAIIEQLADSMGDEWMEWCRMTPAERWQASGQLWDAYLAMGGSLDPEPDTQSPFYVLPA